MDSDSKILQRGMDVGIHLETRQGNTIPTFRAEPHPPDKMKAGDSIHRSSYPNIKLRSLDSSYNCIGMVFAFRRAWIEPCQVSKLLEDDEYQVVSRQHTMPGDLVVYYRQDKICHMGIIFGIEQDVANAELNILVLSKWGYDGEYLHQERDVPIQYGNTLVYFSEKKEYP